MTATSIARLHVTLDDVKPAVRRWVEVPLAIRLDRLHLVLQAAMGGAGQEGSVGEADGRPAEGGPAATSTRSGPGTSAGACRILTSTRGRSMPGKPASSTRSRMPA